MMRSSLFRSRHCRKKEEEEEGKKEKAKKKKIDEEKKISFHRKANKNSRRGYLGASRRVFVVITIAEKRRD